MLSLLTTEQAGAKHYTSNVLDENMNSVKHHPTANEQRD